MQHRETVLVATATASAAAAAASPATDHADHVLWLKAKRYDVLLPWFVIVARTTEVRIARNIQGDPVVEWTAVSKARRERRALRRRRARLARAARTAPGEIKISAAIIRMIEPYSPEDLELDRAPGPGYGVRCRVEHGGPGAMRGSRPTDGVERP